MAWPAFDPASGNPYTRLLYEDLSRLGLTVHDFSPSALARGRYSILHLHWPETQLGRRNTFKVLTDVRRLFGAIDTAKTCGTKLVWTIHNLESHERFHPLIEWRFWKSFVSRVDGAISMSDIGLARAYEKHPLLQRSRAWVIPHGHYRDVYPASMERDEARQRLGISQSVFVITFLGRVRPYKNVTSLVRAFRLLEDEHACLLLAGKPNLPGLAREVSDLAGDDRRIRLILDFVPEEEVQLYLRASDLVVLPYADLLNSGAALLALSFDRPILVPRLGVFPELARAVGADWIRMYEGGLTSGLLKAAMDWTLTVPRGSRPVLDAFDRRDIARRTRDAYFELAGSGVPAGRLPGGGR